MLPVVAADTPPNLIVIFCDDLGYGDLGCYGSTKNRTPQIDRLAEGGMRFSDFYSSSPVCTPSLMLSVGRAPSALLRLLKASSAD